MHCFDLEKFKRLRGLELGRYVDEIEHHGIDHISSEVIISLLAEKEGLALDHIIYLVRWGAMKNINTVVSVIIQTMRENYSNPGLQVTLLRTLRLLPNINQDVYESLEHMPSSVPNQVWEEYLQALKRKSGKGKSKGGADKEGKGGRESI